MPCRWGESKQCTSGMNVTCNRKDIYIWDPGKGVGKNTVTVEYEELSGLSGQYKHLTWAKDLLEVEAGLEVGGWDKASLQRAFSAGGRLLDVLEFGKLARWLLRRLSTAKAACSTMQIDIQNIID